MKIPIYQIDAFTKTLFGGNPAAICHLPEWLDDETLLNIAKENNLAETGYFVKKEGYYEIRWFMPYEEIDLCGHATLAAAYVIFNHIDTHLDEVTFSSKSGILKAKKEDDGSITLDFPANPPQEIDIPKEVYEAFDITLLKAYAGRDLMITVSSEDEIQNVTPDLFKLKGLPYLCTIITAKGEKADFVSRVFDANPDIPLEDPVTGSAHTMLVPYWARMLNKNELQATQLSDRKGELQCRLENGRVFLTGYAVPYLTGEIEVN